MPGGAPGHGEQPLHATTSRGGEGLERSRAGSCGGRRRRQGAGVRLVQAHHRRRQCAATALRLVPDVLLLQRFVPGDPAHIESLCSDTQQITLRLNPARLRAAGALASAPGAMPATLRGSHELRRRRPAPAQELPVSLAHASSHTAAVPFSHLLGWLPHSSSDGESLREQRRVLAAGHGAAHEKSDRGWEGHDRWGASQGLEGLQYPPPLLSSCAFCCAAYPRPAAPPPSLPACACVTHRRIVTPPRV